VECIGGMAFLTPIPFYVIVTLKNLSFDERSPPQKDVFEFYPFVYGVIAIMIVLLWYTWRPPFRNTLARVEVGKAALVNVMPMSTVEEV